MRSVKGRSEEIGNFIHSFDCTVRNIYRVIPTANQNSPLPRSLKVWLNFVDLNKPGFPAKFGVDENADPDMGKN